LDAQGAEAEREELQKKQESIQHNISEAVQSLRVLTEAQIEAEREAIALLAEVSTQNVIAWKCAASQERIFLVS